MAIRKTRQLAVVASAALLLGGCGGTTLSVSSQPSTVAQAPTTPKPKPKSHAKARSTHAAKKQAATTTPAGNANSATYPTAFTAQFITKCVSRGGTQVRCACEVTSVEEAVNFTAFKAALKNLVSGRTPQWYTAAIRPCQTIG